MLLSLVLGPPSNVRVAFSSSNCSDVTLSWNAPLDQQHGIFTTRTKLANVLILFFAVITGYSISVSRTSEPSVEHTFFSSMSEFLLSLLACCSTYSYRISTRVANQSVQIIPFVASFITHPDFTGKSLRSGHTLLVCCLHLFGKDIGSF